MSSFYSLILSSLLGSNDPFSSYASTRNFCCIMIRLTTVRCLMTMPGLYLHNLGERSDEVDVFSAWGMRQSFASKRRIGMRVFVRETSKHSARRVCLGDYGKVYQPGHAAGFEMKANSTNSLHWNCCLVPHDFT